MVIYVADDLMLFDTRFIPAPDFHENALGRRRDTFYWHVCEFSASITAGKKTSQFLSRLLWSPYSHLHLDSLSANDP